MESGMGDKSQVVVDAGNSAITKAGDAISAGAIVGAFLGWLPSVAAFVAIMWYFIQIYESKTFQTWVRRRRMKKRKKRSHH